MIQVLNKVCPGDCANCDIAESTPNFNYYSCVLHQIFQKTIKLEKDQKEMRETLASMRETGKESLTIINSHNESYHEKLPEQERQERALDE